MIQLPCSSLCIGEWRRIKPLICLFSRRNQCFTWYLSSESVGFKLECPRSCVTKITFSGPTQPTAHEFSEGVNSPLGHLIIELERPPQFYMEVFRSSAKASELDTGSQKASWRQCTDFTESKQATSTLRHVVSGPYSLLRHAVMQLYESSGSMSGIVEFQDHGYSEQPSHQGWGQPMAQSQQQHPYQVEPSVGGFFSPTSQLAFPSMDGDANFYQIHGAGPWSENSSWSSNYPQAQMVPANALPPLNQSLGSPTPSMPSSAGALDFTGLRIESAGPSPTEHSLQQQQQQPISPQHRMQAMQWPMSSTSSHHHQPHEHFPAAASSWTMSETMQHPSGSLSAPAHDQRSLEAQQRLQARHSAQEQIDRSHTPTSASGMLSEHS